MSFHSKIVVISRILISTTRRCLSHTTSDWLCPANSDCLLLLGHEVQWAPPFASFVSITWGMDSLAIPQIKSAHAFLTPDAL